MNDEKKILIYTGGLIIGLHWGQKDMAGEPYVEHPTSVAERAVRLNSNLTLDGICAALLHDVVEDTDMDYDGLLEIGYPQRVIDLVSLLTHIKEVDGLTYREYIQKIADSKDLEAITIKLADLLDNSTPKRLKKLPEDKKGVFERLVKRYDMARSILEPVFKELML